MLKTHVIHGSSAQRVLLFIHGLVGDEHQLAGLIEHLDPTGQFHAVLPRGLYSTEEAFGKASRRDGWTWYCEGDDEFLRDSMRRAMDELTETLTAICDAVGSTPEDAVVGGFSLGATMAMAMGYRRGTLRIAGVLAPSPGFSPPLPESDFDFSNPAPALVQCGGEDTPVAAHNMAWALSSRGVPVVWREYPGVGHHPSAETLADSAAWLEQICRGERPRDHVEKPRPMPEELRDPKATLFWTNALDDDRP